MHPRLEEVSGTLPAQLGTFLEAHPRLFALDRSSNAAGACGRARSAGSCCSIVLAALKPMRRSTLRHSREMAHLDAGSGSPPPTSPKNYDLAVEILRARRLVKGYSDTHARGLSKFDRVVGTVPLLVERRRRRRMDAAAARSGAAGRGRHRARRRAQDRGDALASIRNERHWKGNDKAQATRCMQGYLLRCLRPCRAPHLRLPAAIALADGPRRPSSKTLERQLVLRLSTAP